MESGRRAEIEGNDTIQRDPPIWARAVAAGLLLFASWWLLDTESVRAFVGDSIGALCLGVIAVSILQGMHLPLAIWPEGPWRKQFSPLAVVVTAAIIATMILVSQTASLGAVVESLDIGTGITVVIGSVGLGFAAGFVKQKKYLAWYCIALLLGILPAVGTVVVTAFFAGDQSSSLCLISASTTANSCSAALLPSLVFLTGLGIASKLVTEEIAFRRMLIGVAGDSGLSPILFSSLIALAWYLTLSRLGVGDTGLVAFGAIGALAAGSIYVLSGSLITSALFSGVYSAGNVSVAVAVTSAGASTRVSSVSLETLIVASVVGLSLAAIVLRKHGFRGNLKEANVKDVISS
jgi:hypothetical protein